MRLNSHRYAGVFRVESLSSEEMVIQRHLIKREMLKKLTALSALVLTIAAPWAYVLNDWGGIISIY
jgi:hypothetical protein